MLRRALFAVPLVLLAGAASANEEKKKEGKGDVGQYVDLQPVGLPIVVKGQLVNYVFVYIRLNLTSSANAAKLREREPYFRDALVRAAHRTPFTLPSDWTKIDVPRLTAALYREASAITGPGQIRNVVVTSQQPRRRVATPTG
jgi:flagellar basal body-associated protein FliL